MGRRDLEFPNDSREFHVKTQILRGAPAPGFREDVICTAGKEEQTSRTDLKEKILIRRFATVRTCLR